MKTPKEIRKEMRMLAEDVGKLAGKRGNDPLSLALAHEEIWTLRQALDAHRNTLAAQDKEILALRDRLSNARTDNMVAITARNAELTNDLAHTRKELQDAIESYTNVNEDLKKANRLINDIRLLALNQAKDRRFTPITREQPKTMTEAAMEET